MGSSREIDKQIAEDVFDYQVTAVDSDFYELSNLGLRPLPNYSQNIEAAWSVAEKLNIALVPVAQNSWFAMVGKSGGWVNPSEFLLFLNEANFSEVGAAIGTSAAETICRAALNAIEKRRIQKESVSKAALETLDLQ